VAERTKEIQNPGLENPHRGLVLIKSQFPKSIYTTAEGIRFVMGQEQKDDSTNLTM
jgi:hypothetical protein